MEQKYRDELIDAFLKKKLNADDQSMIDQLLATDPAFAETLAESKEAYKYLQYLRDQQIRKKLQEYDKKQVNIQKRVSYRRWLGVGVLFFVTLILGWLELVQFCKPENIALRYFEPIEVKPMSAILSADEITKLELANRLFETGDFENAAGLYQVFTKVGPPDLQANAKWNVLMSQLAISGPDLRWKEALNEFPVEPDHPLYAGKKKLLQFLKSPMYRLGTIVSPSAFSAIKPRLI